MRLKIWPNRPNWILSVEKIAKNAPNQQISGRKAQAKSKKTQ
jgi:hypothetical protein